MKKCLECNELLYGKDRVMSRKKYCSPICKSKYRTSSGSRIDSHLWVNFKIREVDYNILLKKQNNRCAICYRDRSEFSKNFAVDHDHRCCSSKKSCGKCIRGLICFDCNIALGHLKEDPKILQNALNYLNRSA
jgi:hypothetical protein